MTLYVVAIYPRLVQNRFDIIGIYSLTFGMMLLLARSQRTRPAKEIKRHHLFVPLIPLLSLLATVACCDPDGADGFAFELLGSVVDQSRTDYITYARLLQHAYAVPQSSYCAREY